MSKTTIYEIINPSDPYTMESDDPCAAAVACCILGGGRYGLDGPDGEDDCPIFLFGGHEAWFKTTHDTTIEAVLESRPEKVIEALRSVTIGSRQDRKEFYSAIAHMTPEAAEQFRAERHDQRRSSMNNIGARAAALADALSKPRKAKAGASQ